MTEAKEHRQLSSNVERNLENLMRKEAAYFAEKGSQLGGFQQGADLVESEARDEAVGWLCEQVSRGDYRKHFGVDLGPDTLNLTVALVDEILTSTRVRSKYLHCLCLSSLYLAMKLCEETEALPSLAAFTRALAGARYSVPELVRMERTVLDRLDWGLSLPTIHSFLELMLAVSFPPRQCAHLLGFGWSGTTPLHASGGPRALLDAVLANHSLHLLCNPSLSPLEHSAPPRSPGFKPSTLALALYSLCLERSVGPRWLGQCCRLQEILKVCPAELIRCRETVSSLCSLEDKENGRPPFPPHLHKGERSPRKRLRQRSKGRDSCGSGAVSRKIKTRPEDIYIEEIAEFWVLCGSA